MFAVFSKFVHLQDLRAQDKKVHQDNQTLLSDIKQAQFEWVDARARYEEAVDFDQIEYTLYFLLAAEKKYSFLLNQAKQRRIIKLFE